MMAAEYKMLLLEITLQLPNLPCGRTMLVQFSPRSPTKLVNMRVKVFNGIYSLFTAIQDPFSVKEVEALADVVPLVVSMKPRLETLEKAKIVAVSDFDLIKVCLVCKRGNVIPDDDEYGHCSECSASMLLKSCAAKTSAQFAIRANCFTYNLRADGVHLAGIA